MKSFTKKKDRATEKIVQKERYWLQSWILQHSIYRKEAKYCIVNKERKFCSL